MYVSVALVAGRPLSLSWMLLMLMGWMDATHNFRDLSLLWLMLGYSIARTLSYSWVHAMPSVDRCNVFSFSLSSVTDILSFLSVYTFLYTPTQHPHRIPKHRHRHGIRQSLLYG
mmetsp:Transcript_27756/g.69239  ORF Transcript_27756/g.69239 Transcript_27756/m.69239 type:complete len:114 (-) Transcript_27756:532-873(-)